MPNLFCSPITGSVIGETHKRQGLPNQDSVDALELPGSNPGTIIAVSDGHGSKSCFRSDIGSSLAVKTAVRIVREMYETHLMHESIQDFSFQRKNAFQNFIRKDLGKLIVTDWQNQVEEHFRMHPADMDVAGPKLWQAYGATLTTMLVTNDLLIVCCLGDGEVLCLRDSGVDRLVPLNDETSIGEDTDSLCLTDAGKRFRVHIEIFFDQDPPPLLVLACTDGFSNAFRTSEDFKKAAVDFWQQLGESEEGVEFVKTNLESWLQEYSSFSGDDVTVGILYRREPMARRIDSAVYERQDSKESSQATQCTTAEVENGEITFIEGSDVGIGPDSKGAETNNNPEGSKKPREKETRGWRFFPFIK